jgi:hypothetical protein
VNDDVVHRNAMGIVSLNAAGSGVPDLDGTVLGRRDHPFAFTVKSDPGNVGSVAVEGEDSIRIRGLDVIELDRVVAGGGPGKAFYFAPGKYAFVSGDVEFFFVH